MIGLCQHWQLRSTISQPGWISIFSAQLEFTLESSWESPSVEKSLWVDWVDGIGDEKLSEGDDGSSKNEKKIEKKK